MNWKVDYVSRICIQVEADTEEEAENIANAKLRESAYIRTLVTNAEVENITPDDEEEESYE